MNKEAACSIVMDEAILFLTQVKQQSYSAEAELLNSKWLT